MSLKPFRSGGSILTQTLFLAISTALVLTAINLGFVFLQPPPRDTPLSAYEVARLLKGEPIAKDSSNIKVEVSRTPPALPAGTASDELIKEAIAYQLGLTPDDVRLHRAEAGRPRRLTLSLERREIRTYGLERFNPIIFGAFTAAARFPDGSWRVVERDRHDTVAGWQMATALRLLLLLAVVAVIAWLFSKRIARPIRSFATAAERIGRDEHVEPVDITGPAEIRRAAVAVNDMQTRIGRYIAERTSVVGALAHDLRTPLSRLNFHLAAAPEEIRLKAEAEIGEMEQMIASTLEFVENETRPRSREPVDLALLVEGVVDDFSDLGRDVAIGTIEPAIVVGDALLLKRLFGNLISNALNYGHRASVTLGVAGREATVEIADQGPGLTAEDLERAFEPFYRAESSRNRATGGMGLGLAIVRAAARRHGGEVTLSNRPDGGLVARVRLPTF